MIAVDSSVAVAGFASWHEQHRAARDVLDARPRLVAHAAFETYSVLTRLPPPHRAPGKLVAEFLQRSFADPYLCLADTRYPEVLRLIADSSITGGATYDALIAATAADNGATLVSLDARAARTYQLVGASVQLLAG